jgi:hypothetical protein
MTSSTEIALYLWIINLIEMTFVGYIFVREYKKANTKFYLGVMLFYFIFVVARLCEIIRIYFNTEGYDLVPPYTGLNFILKTCYTLFSYIGITILYFVLERYVFTRTKKIFTALVPIACALSIWYTFYSPTDPIYQLLFNIVIPIYAVILLGIVGMYIYLALKSSGEVRRNSIMIVLGILLFELGLIFALSEVQTSIFAAIPLDVLIISAPILSIIGVILQIRGFKTSIS